MIGEGGGGARIDSRRDIQGNTIRRKLHNEPEPDSPILDTKPT
jgi:hypothetical protein